MTPEEYAAEQKKKLAAMEAQVAKNREAAQNGGNALAEGAASQAVAAIPIVGPIAAGVMMADAAARAGQSTGQSATPQAITPQGTPTSNFQQSDATKAAIAEQQAKQDAINAQVAARPAGIARTPSIAEMTAANAAEIAKVDALTGDQASRVGVDVGQVNTQAGGIAGFFGGKDVGTAYTAGGIQDTTTAGNKAVLAERLAGVDARGTQTMQAAQVGPAAQMQAAQLGPAAQAQAAQLGPAATIAQGPQDQFRAQQMTLAQQLGQGAIGQGPSAAQAQLKLATDRNMSQSLALALGARGGNQAGAMKQAQMQRALISQEAGGQSAALAAQEQQAAQQSLGAVLAGGRGADIGLATDQAGLQQQTALQQGQFGQQTALANAAATNTAAAQNADLTQGASAANQAAANAAASQNAQLQQAANAQNLTSGIDQQAQKDQMISALIGQGLTLDEAKRQAEIQQAQFNAKLLAEQDAAKRGVAMSSSAGAGQALGQTAAAIGGVIATAASDRRVKRDIRPGERRLGELLSSTSDERAKTDVHEAARPLGELLGAAGAHDYRYKDPGKPMRGEGRFVSPMAQELERTAIGRSMVRDTPDGKIVDYGKGLGAMLSGLGWVHRRLAALEGGQHA